MIQISKAQAQYLRSHGVREGITRTMTQKSHRHNYYCSEEKYILALLSDFESQLVVTEKYDSK